MSESQQRPDAGSGDKPSGGGQASGSSGGAGGGSRNRNRNRSRSGGGASSKSGGGDPQAGGSRTNGGRGGSSGGGAKSGGRSGGQSGNRRPQGSGGGRGGGNRSGQGHNRDRVRTEAGHRPQVPNPPTPVVDRSAEIAEEAAAKANRHKATRLCLIPGLIAGIIVGVVLMAVGAGVYAAAAAFIVVTLAVMALLWQGSSHSVIHALGAVPSEEQDRPRLHNLVAGLCATMGLPRPAICVVDSQVPNAMAVGRDPSSATLIVTTALDQHLTLVELEGVLAHELVHVKRLDTLLAGTALAVMAPLSTLVGVERAISQVHVIVGQGREFSADQRAARVVRYPPGLGSALEAMATDSERVVSWPPGAGRKAALTRWLWIDPMVGSAPDTSIEGNLDDTRVRAQAQSLR